VVIRASGTDAYNPYILGLCACDSVETFVFKNHNGAYQPFVIEHIKNAEALFIAGGDQSDYVNLWKGTPVEDAINYLANVKKVPIGGTSAGMAVLGEFLYSAMTNSSLTSEEALADPFHKDLTVVSSTTSPIGSPRSFQKPENSAKNRSRQKLAG